MTKESPEYLRMSLAAAMTLDFEKGLFYRNAKSPCINLLVTYDSGCVGNCAYCGLQNKRPGEYSNKSFIRVEWPAHKLSDIIQRISERKNRVKRICLSMITNKRSIKDTVDVATALRQSLDIPVSLLISPTILSKEILQDFKKTGADMVGIAVDTATPDIFDEMRGKGVNGPHRWEKYWKCFEEAIEVFGKGNVGMHLIVGLGETEREMIETIQRAYDLGGSTHLFSFYPENESLLVDYSQPPMGQYRRVQLARYLIDEGIASLKDFTFDDSSRLLDYNIPDHKLSAIIEVGKPFMTSGCPGRDGEVACNRPYANCLPGDDIRNYPFYPDKEDIQKIRVELQQ